MSYEEERYVAALRALSPLPRLLFRLHNFYDVDVVVMAERLSTDEVDILACLAEARTMIHGRYSDASTPRFDPRAADLPIARLERRMRQNYRDHQQTAFIEAGYSGAVSWPELSFPIDVDEAAAAVFILSFLPAPLRKTVARFSRPNVVAVDLWRAVLPWRRGARRRLLDVTNELRCSGWQAYDIWLANRIAPDRYYPDGIVSFSRLRRPLPKQGMGTEEGWLLPTWPDDPERQHRFDSLPGLTQDVYTLFQFYGRNAPEIAKRLGIGRRGVSRRIRSAIYVVAGWPIPSLRWTILFNLRMNWSLRTGQIRRAWRALRE